MIVDELVAVLGYDLRDTGDMRRFQAGLDRAEKSAQTFAASLRQVAVVAAGALAAVGAGRALGGFVNDLTGAGSSVERLALQLEALEGSAEGAQRAADFVMELSDATGNSLSQMEDLYRRAKSFGLDPQSGSLADIMDSAAKYGADLDGVILALGQATAKQKLQGEEVLQLLERGIPVWELLTNVTGKSVAQLQDMQQKGELGLDYVQLLISEMGKDAEGFSQKQADLFEGMTKRIGNTWTKFLRMIADSGYFEALKGRMRDLRDRLIEWERDGTLQAIAQNVSNALVAIMDFAAATGRIAARVGQRLGQAFGLAADGARALGEAISKLTGMDVDWATALGVGSLLAFLRPFRALLVGLAAFLKVPLAIAAAFAVIDDIATYFEGGESWLAQFDGVKEALDGLAAAGRRLSDAWNSLPEIDWGGMFDGLPGMGVFDGVLSALGSVGDRIREIIADPLTAAVDAFITQPIQRVTAAIESVASVIETISFAIAKMVDMIPELPSVGDITGGIGSAISSLIGSGETRPARSIRDGAGVDVDEAPEPDLPSPGAATLRRRSRSRAAAGDADNLAAAAEAISNAAANVAAMGSTAAAERVVEDHSQDNRDQSSHVTVQAPVTQHITTMQQAPTSAARAVGSATGNAVGQAATAQASRVEAEPAF